MSYAQSTDSVSTQAAVIQCRQCSNSSATGEYELPYEHALIFLIGIMLMGAFPRAGMSNALRLVSDLNYKQSYDALRFAIAPGACWSAR